MRLIAGAWVLLAALCCGAAAATETGTTVADASTPAAARYDFPVPPDDGRLLFYIQRSMNSNTVVYAANLDGDGRLDPGHPVNVYWLRYNSDGRRRALSFAEKHLVWGVDTRPAGDARGGYIVNLVCYDKRTARVLLGADGKPEAIASIAGRQARLVKAFVMLGDYKVIPKVRFVELFGKDLQTGASLYERFVP